MSVVVTCTIARAAGSRLRSRVAPAVHRAADVVLEAHARRRPWPGTTASRRRPGSASGRAGTDRCWPYGFGRVPASAAERNRARTARVGRPRTAGPPSGTRSAPGVTPRRSSMSATDVSSSLVDLRPGEPVEQRVGVRVRARRSPDRWRRVAQRGPRQRRRAVRERRAAPRRTRSRGTASPGSGGARGRAARCRRSRRCRRRT